MSVERQMVGNEIQTGAERGLDPLIADSGNAGSIPFPEPAVVHKHGVGVEIRRGLKQREARGNASHNVGNFTLSLDLQSIWRIIMEALRFEQRIQFFYERSVPHGFSLCLKGSGLFSPKQ